MCPSKELPSDDWEKLITSSDSERKLGHITQAKITPTPGFVDIEHIHAPPMIQSSETVERGTHGVRLELSNLGTVLILMKNPTQETAERLAHEQRVREANATLGMQASYGRLVHELDALISAKLWMKKVPERDRLAVIGKIFPTYNPEKEEYRVVRDILTKTGDLSRGESFIDQCRKLREMHAQIRLAEREYTQGSWLSVKPVEKDYWYWKALEHEDYISLSDGLFSAWQHSLKQPQTNNDRAGAERLITMREVMVIDNQRSYKDEGMQNLQVVTKLDGISVWRMGTGKGQKIMIDGSDLKKGLGYDPKDPLGKWIMSMEMMLMSQIAYRFGRGYAEYRQAQYGYRKIPKGFVVTPDAFIITRQMSEADWSERLIGMSWRRLDAEEGKFVFESIEDIGMSQEDFFVVYRALRQFVQGHKKLVETALGRKNS